MMPSRCNHLRVQMMNLGFVTLCPLILSMVLPVRRRSVNYLVWKWFLTAMCLPFPLIQSASQFFNLDRSIAAVLNRPKPSIMIIIEWVGWVYATRLMASTKSVLTLFITTVLTDLNLPKLTDCVHFLSKKYSRL